MDQLSTIPSKISAVPSIKIVKAKIERMFFLRPALIMMVENAEPKMKIQTIVRKNTPVPKLALARLSDNEETLPVMFAEKKPTASNAAVLSAPATEARVQASCLSAVLLREFSKLINIGPTMFKQETHMFHLFVQSNKPNHYRHFLRLNDLTGHVESDHIRGQGQHPTLLTECCISTWGAGQLMCSKADLAVFNNIKPFISRWLCEIARYGFKLLI